VLRKAPAGAAHAAFEESLPAVSRFYDSRGFSPAWTTAAGWSAAGDSVLRILRKAAEDGLNPDEYDFPAFAGAAASRDADALARLDVLMSLAVVRYARDLAWGVTLPSEVDSDNAYAERPFTADTVLEKVASAADPGTALSGFAPPGVAYPLVKEGLARLRAVQARGGWSTVSAGPTLRLGDRGLAALLLGPQGWTPERIAAAVATGEQTWCR
jgi:murein L,D-transpeptidase YcbB/YkuD